MRKIVDGLNEFEEFESFKRLTFYHGTSDVFRIEKILNSEDTGVLREDFRSNFRDKIFITTSLLSAKKYASKAALKFGGNPVVYEVIPDFDSLFHKMDNEYLADFADIKKIVRD